MRDHSHQQPAMVLRADALKDADEDVAQLRSGAASFHLVNYCGLPGVGKTVLLQQIFERLSGDTPVLLLDFARGGTQPTRPWSEIAAELEAVAALRMLPDTIERPDETQTPLAQERLVCRAANLELAGSQPLVLLLDNLDVLEYWRWLQEELIQPLLADAGQRALVICASRAPLFWHLWELGERAEVRGLRQLTVDELREMLRPTGQAVLAPEFHTQTSGYPLLVRELLDFLTKHGVAAPEGPRYSADLLRADPDAYVLRYLGLLRRAEVPTLGALIEREAPEVLAAFSGGDTPGRIRFDDHLRTRILPWLRQEKLMDRTSYRIARSLRAAAADLWRAERPQRLAELYRAVATIYAEQFHTQPREQFDAFGEWLFAASAADAGPPAFEQLEKLVATARQAGVQPASLIFKDAELRLQLEQRGLLSAVIDRLEALPPPARDAHKLLTRAEREKFRYIALDRMVWNVPPGEIESSGRPNLYVFLGDIARVRRDLATARRDLDSRTLNDRLRKITPGVKELELEDALAWLHSSGLIDYDTNERVYRQVLFA